MTAAFEGWAVLELLGHRVRYGRVSEVTIFGEPWCRIDFPTDPPTFELYSGKSVYGIRPASEASMRAHHAKPQALASGEMLVDDAEFDEGEGEGDDSWSPDDEDDPPHERSAAPIDSLGENAGRG